MSIIPKTANNAKCQKQIQDGDTDEEEEEEEEEEDGSEGQADAYDDAEQADASSVPPSQWSNLAKHFLQFAQSPFKCCLSCWFADERQGSGSDSWKFDAINRLPWEFQKVEEEEESDSDF